MKARNKFIFRHDKCYIGTENIEAGDTGNKLFFEVVLFSIIASACLIFFLTHLNLIKGYFRSTRGALVTGVLVILILSPFGPHLIAKIITFLWEKLKREWSPPD